MEKIKRDDKYPKIPKLSNHPLCNLNDFLEHNTPLLQILHKCDRPSLTPQMQKFRHT